MQTPSRILVIALVSAIGGLIFLANTVAGNNSLIRGVYSPVDSSGLIPIADAIGKDLMLDVSPQLHPTVLVGESAKGIKFQHWIDNDIHCEDCLRMEIPNNGKKAGAAFSNEAGYNFEGAKKVKFYIMGEVEGAKVKFKAVGNDKAQGANNSSNNKNQDLFKNQDFALTSQNVTVNQTWGYSEMSLQGVPAEKLKNVKYPFAFEVEQGKGKTTILYLKGIEYSAEPVQDKYVLEPEGSSANLTASTMAIAAAPLNVTLSDNATGTVTAPATVQFNATVSSGKEPYSFDWDFGDGARERHTSGNKIHIFEVGGSYNVTADVTDSLNSTGSASTVVNVKDQIASSEPVIASGENNTQEPQGTDSVNATNTTRTTNAPANAGDNSSNNTETSGNNDQNNTTVPTASANNSPPIPNAGNDLTGKPNEKVTLDGSKSTDPDKGDVIETYQWKQESGPSAKINDKNSPTPVVTLPGVNKDTTLVFSLTVNDGTVDSKKQDTVSIFIDTTNRLSSDVQEKVLPPADVKSSEWILEDACKEKGQIECLSDGSDGTFVSAAADSIDDINLYSFGQFTAGGAGVDANSVVIDRVTAEITAKKIGNTGYVSFVIDDPKSDEHYITPSISIASNNSFQKYNYVWDTNPVTGEKWTSDSLNSLVAGFKYDGGQAGVQISELQLTISYHLPKPLPADNTNSGEDSAKSNDSQPSADKANNNSENSTSTAKNTDQQDKQPTTAKTDSNNSTRPNESTGSRPDRA
ncbi:MAG: PKD domain-containing protein [Thermoproteota archaeon]|nr:PKD domain-containing protein [Thermoproteota archaeon]